MTDTMPEWEKAVVSAIMIALDEIYQTYTPSASRAAWTAVKQALAEQGMRVVYRTAHLGPVVATTRAESLAELQRLGQEFDKA